jgi:hypothetical protein
MSPNSIGANVCHDSKQVTGNLGGAELLTQWNVLRLE